MEWRKKLIEAIENDFKKRQEVNPRFSLRAYSKKIGISSGSLSEMLSNKADWNLSFERAEKLLESLPFDKDLKNHLRARMGIKPAYESAPKTDKHDHYKLLTNWAYFPILFYLDLPESFKSLDLIAKKLKLTKDRVSEIVEELISYELVKKNSDGTITRLSNAIIFGDKASSEVVKDHHRQNLKIAEEALDKVKMENRDFTTTTFVGSRENLEVLKSEIRQLHMRASALMNSNKEACDTVYRLSIQFFPMEFE